MPTRAAAHYYKQNRLQQLRGFCYTAQTGSVSRAAQRMDLTQPSVSLQIQALEREFHATLFARRGPKITLTADGQALYKLAAPLVEAMDSLHEAFTARHDRVETGRLDIAAGEATILYVLPRFVQRFARAHPRVELKLHNVPGRDGLAMLRAGDVDFAVGSMLDEPDDIIYQPLFTFDPMLITALGHPLARRRGVTLEEISRYPLILPPKALTTWRLVDEAFKKRGLNYEIGLEAGGWEVIKKYVQMGVGVSIVTSICLTGKERLARIPLNAYFQRRTYGVVTRKDRFLSPPARRFIEIMQPQGPKR